MMSNLPSSARLPIVQIIRSLYHPFLVDWHAALGTTGLLILKAEDLIERPTETRANVAAFIGLPLSAVSSAPLPSMSYKSLHAASLKAASAQPMNAETRTLAEDFFRTDLERLARLFPHVTWPHGSTSVDAAGIAAAVKRSPE